MAEAQPSAGTAATDRLGERIRAAAADGMRLRVCGGDSKAFLAHPQAVAEPLATSELSGIVAFEPSELVITVRAGTRLTEVEQVLAEAGQMLGFEAPRWSPVSTVGGVVASGFSGPRRAFAGSLRDFVLGVEVLNGRAELLRFGGQVMKNVAGYDIARLYAGSFGALGVITEVSLRVMPRPACECTFSWRLERAAAAARMVELQARAWPSSALAWHEDTLRLRVSGSAEAIEHARAALAPETITEDDGFWGALRDGTLPALCGGTGTTLWRLSLPPAADDPFPVTLVDWGGAQRWVRQDEAAMSPDAACRAVGGYAMCFRDAAGRGVLARPDAAPCALMKRIRSAFDPDGVFAAACYQPWLDA